MKKRKKKQPQLSYEQLLVEALSAVEPEACSTSYISQKLGLKSKQEQATLQKILQKAVTEKRIYRVASGRYALPPASNQLQQYEGVIDHVRPSLAYVRCKELDRDPTLRGRQLTGLYHGDKVRIGILPKNREGQPKAQLLSVLTRGSRSWVGRLDSLGRDFVFHGDSPRLHQQLIVRKADAATATVSDKVEVRPLSANAHRRAYGKVCSVLGPAGTHEVELHSILCEFNIKTTFSKEALSEAEVASESISASELQNRKDFRDYPCFTIDPEDAKDFDDALSLRSLPGSRFEVSVHIADVSHYVCPGTSLDREAQERGNSVYLVDRTVPMLPERLSNLLCSLRPKEDKLAFSAVFVLNEKAEVQTEWFGRSVICSQHRFSYDEALSCLQTGEGLYATQLQQLYRLAKQLRERRFASGALQLHALEFKFKLDKQGRPLQVYPKVQHEAHYLIEELMLLANQRVAEYVWRRREKRNQDPLFVYRVHDPPERERLETLSLFASKFGYNIQWQEGKIATQLNTLLETVKNRPEEPLLQQLAIRSMAKAIYSTDPLSHFGLGFSHYTHFTSPIRRYSDLLVHRLLLQYLDDRKPIDTPSHSDSCTHISEMERRAIGAERASTKYKQAEFLKQHIGKVFKGILSGVTEWGFYVIMQPHYCEGMVRLSSIRNDYYSYDEKRLCLVSRRSGRKLTLGDTVEVRVQDVNLSRRQVDLSWIQSLR